MYVISYFDHLPLDLISMPPILLFGLIVLRWLQYVEVLFKLQGSWQI